jgi:hypothetical protein
MIPPGQRPGASPRSFEEERRRTKVIPRLTTERAAMKLVFAVLIRCSERWSRVSITDIEGHQLKLMRAELGNRSTADFRREGGTLEEKEDRVMTQVAPFTGDSGLDLRRVAAVGDLGCCPGEVGLFSPTTRGITGPVVTRLAP